MSAPSSPQVAVYLPADLVARMEELKQDREEDRDKSIQQLIEEFCQSYVAIREGHRWEREHAAELERLYLDSPDSEDKSDEWADVYPEDKEAQS